MIDGRQPRSGVSAERPRLVVTNTASCVVVIDDEPANVTLLERVLTAADVPLVRGFTDPREALAWIAATPPDLVLLDLHMPHMDGFHVMEALDDTLADDVFVPVLVLTADITDTTRRRALAAGAKDFLTKPIDRIEVVLRVSNLLETSALYRRVREHNLDLQADLHQLRKAERRAAAQRRRRDRQIDRALEPDAIRMVYQPITDLHSGQTVGAEALARFTYRPERGPQDWFTEAHDLGRGAELELAAVALALEDLDQLPPDAFLAVNVSSETATTVRILELLARGAASDRLIVELTEHTPVGDYDDLYHVLTPLRAEGVRVAVDDTGTGYASLNHILQLRPDIVKLDMSLTRAIDSDPIRRSLAAALMRFADEIDATVIAEGIETADELDTLRRLGIPWGQGYYLARPAPPPVPASPPDITTSHSEP